MRVGLVQPDIPQAEKWSAEFERHIYRRLADLTVEVAAGRPDLVVWPETAVPYCLRADTGTWAFVSGLAAEGAPILVGSMDVEGEPGEERCYNSSFLVGPDGSLRGEYRKRHLVPFGEYVPFDKAVPWLARFSPLGFSCTPGATATVFRCQVSGFRVQEERGAGGEPGTTDNGQVTIPFTVLICFEDSIASLSREAVRRGARLLINQTNDAWFEGSCAAVQHMSHCVFRCVENRVPAARCANKGVTCLVDRSGAVDAVTASLLRNGEGSLTQCRVDEVLVPEGDMPLTFYSRYGDLPFALPCGVLAAVSVAAVVAQQRRRSCRLV
jgi:apolipoprotein N-acyltransferase